MERELLQQQIEGGLVPRGCLWSLTTLCVVSPAEEAEEGALFGGQQRGGYVGIPASSFVPPPSTESWDLDVESEC